MHQILTPNNNNILLATRSLALNEIVAFPTETVYGLGGNAYSDKAVTKIFQYKKRQKFNPLSVCYPNLNAATYDVIVNDIAWRIAELFLPGPITLVLNKRKESKLSPLCSAGLDTIGVRVPNNETAIKLLLSIPFPLAAPSANISSHISPTTANAVSEELSDNERLIILDDGKCLLGIESTIVDVTGDIPQILRIGAISRDEISDVCGFEVPVKRNDSKIKHYCTKKTLVLNAEHANNDDALLAFGEPFQNSCKYIMNLSKKSDLNEAASNLFCMLRDLDKTDASRICIMRIPNEGIGVVINEKLHQQ